ncbi:MAG: M20/M25/M40 family metallo-hydrolase [Clostridia bacterium]|nr:M20/M25/M40 family metallo-hydrolase [Clostridia bacterium]
MNDIERYFENPVIRAEFESDLSALLSVPSVAGKAEGIYPYGRECARAVDTALAIAKRLGFRTENHEYHCASAVLGESEREIGIVAHLDVVPAGGGWHYEPYALTVDREKGVYIGRGSLDDKGPLLVAMYAMRYFADNNIKLPFSIRLIMGSDEEVGSSDMRYFKKVCTPPEFSFTPDADFPVIIGEKGIMHLAVDLGEADESLTALSAGTVVNAVPGEAHAEIGGGRIDVAGRTAHASAPHKGVNAVALLADTLLRTGVLAESDVPKFEFLKEAGEDIRGRVLGTEYSDEHFGPLTSVASVLSLKDGHIVQCFDIRFPMSRDFDRVRSDIEKAVSARGYKIISCGGSNGYYSSADSKEIKALTSACEEVFGRECKPFTIGGGTYARELPNTVAFGPDTEEYHGILGAGTGGCHDSDEYFAIELARKSFGIYVRSILNLKDCFR